MKEWKEEKKNSGQDSDFSTQNEKQTNKQTNNNNLLLNTFTTSFPSTKEWLSIYLIVLLCLQTAPMVSQRPEKRWTLH